MVLKNANKLSSSVTTVRKSTTTTTTSSAGRQATIRKEVPAAGSSSVASPVSPDIHSHCENCINVSTCKDSSCPIVPCDCGHKLHQCKLQDHALLCREANFKVREALLSRVCGSYRTQGFARCSIKPVWKSEATVSNSMSSPSHLGTGCASQDYLPTSTPPTSPLDLSSPSHSTTNSNTPCAGKRFLLDDAEMDVLEALAKDNPDLLTHGVNLDIEETITCSPEDETPPGLQDSDMLSPTSENVGPSNLSERDSIPSVEIFCVESDETQKRTDSLVELGENIVAEAVQLAKATVEDMLKLKREQETSLSSNKPDGKALEQKQTSELLDSLMKDMTPKPATRYSLAGDDADSPSDEPDNNEPDSEQLLDDASLSQHGPDEPETISEESSSCLEPIRIQAAKSPTLEDIPDLPDDQEKHKVIHEVPETENEPDDNPLHRRRDIRSRANRRDDDDEDEDSQNSDTESHSPSSVVRYHCTGTVVRKVKKTETTTTSSKMTAGTEGAPAPPNKPCTLQQPDPPESSDENSNGHFNKECNISLARLKDSYVTIAENGLGRDGAFKETAVTGVSLSSLKQSYVQNACNGGGGPLSLPPERTLRARENIPTIDIGRLKNAYNSLGHSEITKAQSPDDLVPVDINALRENFSRQQSIHAAREPSPVEEVKLSVDKKKVQSQFSVDGGEVDSKCKRCQKTVYPAERVRAEKAQYHKQCFRCKECSKTLSAESYNSHEGELYCANHFKQLFQPKANFEVDSGPKGQDLLSGCDELDHDGKQRKHEMIIRENEPMQLSPDVVRCDTRSNMEDLEGLNLNLGSLKSRFENQQKPEDDVKKPTSVADRSALSRSASVLKRLEKYQSVASGEAKADSSDEEGEDEMDKIDLSKKIEVCREMNELKNKWESGKVSKEHREPAKDDLASLRKKICVGRSESMKVVYEKAVQEANTADSKKNSPPDDVAVTHAFATNLKKKFETGEVIREQEAERLEYVRSEKEDDLSVCQETGIAHQAKNMFKQLDKEITSRPQTQTPTPIARTPSESRWNRSPGDPNKNIEIVKASEPGQKDHIEVETTALTERFKFFQNYKEEPTSKKDFRMTPPRELEKENSPAPACERDPNVVVSSSVIDDIPKVDTATKMRQKFQELIESPADKSLSSVETSRPKALKRITPPRETFEDNVVENTPVVDPNVIKCSYKVDDDIQVEADKTKSMKARFENWSDVEQRKNSANLDDDCLPVDNITRNMRAMFETNSNQGVQTNGQTAERNKPKVNRFVFGAGSEICAMCQGKVFPMERREASGLVMHTKCFKCTHCNINLRLDGYSQTGGKLYCEAHYQQLFKVKGNYDEGFGREKWSRTPSPSSQDTPPLNLPPTSSNHTVIA